MVEVVVGVGVQLIEVDSKVHVGSPLCQFLCVPPFAFLFPSSAIPNISHQIQKPNTT
jgi:hypothetical protein